MHKIGLSALLILFIGFFYGQQTQNIKGTVTNSFTDRPIVDVIVSVLLNDSVIQKGFTDEKGEFLFKNIQLGLYDLQFIHLEYESFILPDVTTLSSREMVLKIELVEAYQQLEALEITPQKDRSKNNNEMVTNSVKTIYIQDMQKLAGSLDDPIRVAGMMSGVTASPAFSENFISVRGNSSRGLKYILEGVELNNPAHFARIGSSGGIFTIFSMQILDKSDFFTGAFPAEYSNALSGVFDVNLRHGNKATDEYSIKLGTLGLDFTAEGPFSGNNKATYLVNYRYSTVGMARIFKSPAIPTYQDLSFVLNFPTKKGSLNIFGIGGLSNRKVIAEHDSTLWTRDIERHNLTLQSDMATFGVSYKQHYSKKNSGKLTVMGSTYRQIDNRQYVQDDYSEIIKSKNEYKSTPLSIAYSLKHKFSRRHTNKTGFSGEYATHDWMLIKRNYTESILDTNVLGSGSSQTFKAFTQSRILLNEKTSLNIGVSSLYHHVNKAYAIEPRIGIAYQTKKKAKLSLALGQHSQTEHFATYNYRFVDSLGVSSLPNLDLKLTKAYHAIAGFRKSIFKNHYFNLEAYYQYLTDVPVEQDGTFSMLNMEEIDEVRPLVNDGTGENYGVDFGIERYANKGLYYIINASIFESNYTAGDGIKRSTPFDRKFNVKFLAGKEYIVGKKKGKRNFLGWNTNIVYVGGRPYTPLDLNESALHNETILDESLAYSQRENNLFFMDVTFTYKINKKNRTGIWSLQIKNIFSNSNAIYREYDSVLKKEVTVASTSFFPNLSYKIEF